MVERALHEAAEAMSGRILAGDGSLRFRGVAIDSRQVGDGSLFFALEGDRTDGHRFTTDALDRGAAGVVVHRDPSPASSADSGTWVRVEDTFRALHDLTRHVRRQVPDRLVGITGSMGKTTTKELLAAMLAARFRTAKSPGNLNNLYGFPLSLLNIADDAEWLVAEMGMSTPGELRAVSELGRPDVAVFTNIRAVHLENFGTLEAIAAAKAGLLAGLAADGMVVANADDPNVVRIAERHRDAGHRASGHAGRIVYYGLASADRAVDLELDLALHDLMAVPNGVGSRFRLVSATEQADVELPLHGLYNAENCLAAAAAAHVLGMDLDTIADAVRATRPAAMRGVVERLDGGVLLVDDVYNANPAAVTRALESARLLHGRRYITVLGDMLELGPTAPDLHADVGRTAARDFDRVIGVGPLSAHLTQAAEAAGVDTLHFDDAESAARWAVSSDGPAADDVVLVKGSRGIGLEAVTEALRAVVPAAGEVEG